MSRRKLFNEICDLLAVLQQYAFCKAKGRNDAAFVYMQKMIRTMREVS